MITALAKVRNSDNYNLGVLQGLAWHQERKGKDKQMKKEMNKEESRLERKRLKER
jgi:hypothetical protein